MEFLARHVFPGCEIPRLGAVVAAVEDVGFRIVDVEALGGHYAVTTSLWLRRLRANAGRARALVGERRYRVWSGYLAAAAVAFRAGWIDLHQIVAAHRDPNVPVQPENRQTLYRAGGND